MEFIILILASLGITNAITREYVFEWFRDWLERMLGDCAVTKLFGCETCMGFWVGLALAPFAPQFTGVMLLDCFLYACASSALNKLVWGWLYTR